MTTKRAGKQAAASRAMKFLDDLTGGPLTLPDPLNAIRAGEEISHVEFAAKLGISRPFERNPSHVPAPCANRRVSAKIAGAAGAISRSWRLVRWGHPGAGQTGTLGRGTCYLRYPRK